MTSWDRRGVGVTGAPRGVSLRETGARRPRDRHAGAGNNPQERY